MQSFTSGVFWLCATAGAIGVLLYLFVFDTWVIPGTDPVFASSIVPTLAPGDRILVRRASTPKAGDLVRCASPVRGRDYVVGRVIGVANERVELREGRVLADGKPISTDAPCDPVTMVDPVSGDLVTLDCAVAKVGRSGFSYLSRRKASDANESTIVEPERVYVVSDNRHLHDDSRDFGTVEAATCEHVVYRLWGERFTDSSRRMSILW